MLSVDQCNWYCVRCIAARISIIIASNTVRSWTNLQYNFGASSGVSDQNKIQPKFVGIREKSSNVFPFSARKFLPPDRHLQFLGAKQNCHRRGILLYEIG